MLTSQHGGAALAVDRAESPGRLLDDHGARTSEGSVEEKEKGRAIRARAIASICCSTVTTR